MLSPGPHAKQAVVADLAGAVQVCYPASYKACNNRLFLTTGRRMRRSCHISVLSPDPHVKQAVGADQAGAEQVCCSASYMACSIKAVIPLNMCLDACMGTTGKFKAHTGAGK